MDRKHLEEELSSYLAGELSPAERRAVEEHLAGCAVCTDQLNSLRQLDEILSEADEIEPSTLFTKQVLQKADEPIIAFRTKRTVAWLAIAASIVFLILVLSLKNKVHPPPGIVHWKKPNVEHPVAPAPQPHVQRAPGVSSEDAELIANLDALENMDVIQNYDNLEYLEAAVVAEGEERSE